MIPNSADAAPQESNAESRRPYVFSNLGPAPNMATKSFGVNLYLIDSSFLPIAPVVDYRYRYGAMSNLSLEMHIQSVIMVNQLEVAIRPTFFEGKFFSVGGRAGAGGMIILEGTDKNVLYGFPGLIASIGSDKRQFSVAADMYIPIMGELFTEPGSLLFVSLAFETRRKEASNMYVHLQASSRTRFIGIGTSW